MKTLNILFALLLAIAPCLAADTNPGIGPKGGTMLQNSGPQAEFFIEPDNRITITFYAADLKPVPWAGQIVTVLAAPRGGEVNMELEKKNGTLVSKQTCPRAAFLTSIKSKYRLNPHPSPPLKSFTSDSIWMSARNANIRNTLAPASVEGWLAIFPRSLRAISDRIAGVNFGTISLHG